MKSKFNKIAKTIAVGIFFMALFLNVKFSLENPFLDLNSAVLAQSNSSQGVCFIRFASNCPSGPGGVGGGQRVTCDKSGNYVAGETCTIVKCVSGVSEQLICTENP